MNELQSYLIPWLQSVAQCNGTPDPQSREIQIRAKCAELRQVLIERNHTRPQVEALLTALKLGQGWLDLLERYEVFGRFTPTLAPTPTAIAQPTQGGLVRLPRQQSTAIQPSTPGAIAVTESAGDVVTTLVRGGNVLGPLSLSNKTLFVGGATGSGKSTVARALVCAIHHADPTAEFYFVEPQSESWLGLEQYRSIVRYCTFDDLEVPSQLLAEVYGICQQRYQTNQELVRSGSQPIQEHPIYVVINEWNILYDTWNDLGARERQERGIDKMLNHARFIIRAGRVANIRLILIGQEHSKEATGFSPQLKASMGFISTGMLFSDGTGGYNSVLNLITDTYLLAKHQREALLNVYKEAVKDRTPLLATTLGVPRLLELPDFSRAKSASIVSSYRYKPIHEIHQQPLHLERMAR